MKQKKSLLILIVILIVSALGYVGTTKYTESKALAEAEAEVLLAEENTIYVTQLDTESIMQVTYANGVEYTYNLIGYDWIYEANTGVSVTQSYITSIVNDFSELTAVRDLTGGEDLSAYGLDDTPYYVVLTDGDGVSTTYYLGDASSTGDYYLTIDDKTSVYTVSSDLFTDVSYLITDIVVHDSFATIDSSEMTEVVLLQEGEETSYTSADDGAFDTIATGVSELSFDTCVDEDGSDSLDLYGLDDESKITVTIYYDVEVEVESTDDSEEVEVETESLEAVLYVGTYVEDIGVYYVQVEGSNLVYRIASDTVKSILNIS